MNTHFTTHFKSAALFSVLFFAVFVGFHSGVLQAANSNSNTNSNNILNIAPPKVKAAVLTPLKIVADSQTVLIGQPLPTLTYKVTNLAGTAIATTSVTGNANCVTAPTATTTVANVFPITCSAGTLSVPNYYVATITPATLRVTFAFDFFDSTSTTPVKRVFKLGSVVPVTIQLTDFNQTPMQANSMLAWLVPQELMNAAPGYVPAYTQTHPEFYTWNPDTKQYTFNWDTAGLRPGEYRVLATLHDGMTYSVVITLK